MAVILTKANAIFYEIPRTGTTWLKYALTHLDIEWEQARLLDGINSCPRHSPWWCYPDYPYKYVTVRHPVQWIQSFWKYHSTGDISRDPETWYPHGMILENVKQNFPVWIDHVLENYPGFVSRLYDQFCGPEGCDPRNPKLGKMSRICKQESLCDDLACVLAELGYGQDEQIFKKLVDVPRVNVANTKKLRWDVLSLFNFSRCEKSAIRRFYG